MLIFQNIESYVVPQSNIGADKLKTLEEDKWKLETKLKEELETQKLLKIQVQELTVTLKRLLLTVKVAENAEMMAHNEKMKQQRWSGEEGWWIW